MRVLISVDGPYAPAPISELVASYVAKRPSILEVTEGLSDRARSWRGSHVAYAKPRLFLRPRDTAR